MWKLLALLLWLGLSACSKPPPSAFLATDISGAEYGRSLAGLKDHRGKPGALADFQGQAVLVFFGYTSCPDVCPTTLARLAEVMKKLGDDADRVQVILVTVDPERDKPDRLAAYVSAFNPSFLGLSGDLPATEAVAREFKAFFSRNKASASSGHAHHHEAAADAYTVDHSTGSYVFDPAGRVRLYVKDDAPVDTIVSDPKRLLAGG